MSELGYDGHSAKGGFLPPVALPRRMWAGGQLQFLTPLTIGVKVQRRSTIADISFKQRGTGSLAFVVVQHEITGSNDGHILEEHNIVYREPAHPDAPLPKPFSAPSDAQWSRIIQPSEVLLFRYSALTFNGHRIHYDRSFCTEQEGYDGLVVPAWWSMEFFKFTWGTWHQELWVRFRVLGEEAIDRNEWPRH